jgi:hypothetical protein
VSLIVATTATLVVQYNHGVDADDKWMADWAPEAAFKLLSGELARSASRGELSALTGLGPIEQLSHMRPDTTALTWAGAGLAVTMLIAIARVRLAWWPLHPVLLVLAGSWPTMLITPSFLIGWAVKLVIEKLGGARAVSAAKPVMVGIIAGELLAALGWAAAGAISFALTGQTPPTYHVLVGG